MKKLFIYFSILALIAGFASSCNKDDEGSNNNGSSAQKRLVKEIEHDRYGDYVYTYEYDNSGRCIAETEAGDKTLYSYSGNKIIRDDGKKIITLNSKGFIESMEWIDADDKFTYTYDNQGYLISGFEEGENTTYVWENGNIVQKIWNTTGGTATTYYYKYTNDIFTTPIVNKTGFILDDFYPLAVYGNPCKNLPVSIERVRGNSREDITIVWTLGEDGYPIKSVDTWNGFETTREYTWE